MATHVATTSIKPPFRKEIFVSTHTCSIIMRLVLLWSIMCLASSSCSAYEDQQTPAPNDGYKPCLDSSVMITKYSETLYSKSECVNNGLTLIENPWESSRVNNRVAKILLEEKLGICVNILNTTVTGGLELINQKGNEIPIVMLEFWKSNRVSDYRKYVQNGKYITDLGELGPIGRVGWYIPYFMTQTGNNNEMDDFVRSYRYFRTTPLIPFINVVPQVLSFNTQIIQNLKLNLNVTQLQISDEDSEKYIVNSLENAERTKTPLVAYFWTPHQIFSKPHPPQRVYLPLFTEDCRKPENIKRGLVDCDYPPTSLNKLQSEAVNRLSPQVQLFLKNFHYQSQDQIQILGDIYYKNMTVRDASCKWLRDPNNTLLIQSWFEGPPVPITQNVGFIVGMAHLAVLVGLIFMLIIAAILGYLYRKRSIIKEENRMAPKNPPICIVFTHIQNASLLWTLASDMMKKVMSIHNRVVRMNIKKHKGYEVKTHLDCFMIAFQCPVDAVACCMAIQRELVECEWTNDMMAFPDMQQVVWNEQIIYKGPRVKMGMHFGNDIDAQFDSTTRRFDYFGTTVNKASRVEKVSSGGRVYISAETFQSIRNMTYHEVKPAITRRPSMSYLESYNTSGFKQSILKGEITFENVGERELKGLEGKHTIYWVKDMSNLRYAYIEQFEMTQQRPPSLIGRTIPVAVIDPSEREKYELFEALTQCLADPTKMSEDEKSILLQRILLFPHEIERNRWITNPNTAVLRFVSNFLMNYSLSGITSPQLGSRKPLPSPRTPRRLFEIFNINQ
ncbi:hypothetical protein C9374_004060 [Naegleria lovaniensis]|uniref:Guanylate cyclase domain-containing protein n=1 Tax=Naegleria lovaniensis TaxID=51637 RepID=A0AA88KIZ3_NAELO|nr:uncharacterized protein C9374_004060 [Naegleria lovaniensis]KAG2383389.1 hypothetical protein C9374_004060 [Naegleria lovaniensis]